MNQKVGDIKPPIQLQNPIPVQLQNPKFRFVLLGKWDDVIQQENGKPIYKGKVPFEKDWQNKGYTFDDPKLLAHIKKGLNYGIIGGYGNLRIIDCDNKEFAEYLLKKLPESTLTVMTGSGGVHYYILSDYNSNHVFKNEVGEFRAMKYQVVCPPSIHPCGKEYKVVNSSPIIEIPAERLKEILEPYLRPEISITEVSNNQTRDATRSGKEFREILKLIGQGKTKDEVFAEMKAFVKWTTAPPQYRELSFQKAFEIINKRGEDKTYDDIQETQITKKKNPFKKLHYYTNHLFYYHEFSSLIGLYGRHYIPILKARWYQLHGGILQKEIQFGKMHTDTRMHIAYPLPTEAGKNEIIYGIKKLLEVGIKKENDSYFTISEPISYSPESLVGKYIERLIDNPDPNKKRKIKKKIENRGHLDNDFLEFDECNKLITSDSPEDNQAREYLSKSENPIGRNKVEKRLVDDIPTEKVSYCPNNTNSYYFQPFKKIPESAILQGFMRRKLIPVGNVNLFLNPAEDEIYLDKLSDTDFSYNDYQEKLIQHFELMRTRLHKTNFVFDEDARGLLKDYSLYISGQGKLHSEKIANYCKIIKYSILANLIKMSCIISASQYSNIVNEKSVALAYMDLVELMQNTFDFVYEKTLGDFDYGAKWKGANYKEQECLKYLFQEKAFGLESSRVTIWDFVTLVVKPIFKIGETQARNRYLEMKKKGLIDSKQTNKYDSRVWLNFNPIMHKEYLEDDKGYKGYTTYNMVFEGLKEVSTPLKPLKPLKPLDDTPVISETIKWETN